ncbi:large ribosomal subunit protein bL35m [Culicoides brevitarsis]|uniref:large ribosomal subunit protein bL35m n=1 Tax=Culicoides brevitarsis TaxID=469753 RepID=UPI00307C42A5
MLRALARTAANVAVQTLTKKPFAVSLVPQQRQFSVLSSFISSNPASSLLSKTSLPLQDQSRTVTKFSRTHGKRKTIRAVVKRFKRLDWGIWIRTRTGRFNSLWKKSWNRRARLKQHCFVNGTQSYFLDKCVTKFWRRPKYYVDDIYAPYHQRPEFFVTNKSKIIK